MLPFLWLLSFLFGCLFYLFSPTSGVLQLKWKMSKNKLLLLHSLLFSVSYFVICSIIWYVLSANHMIHALGNNQYLFKEPTIKNMFNNKENFKLYGSMKSPYLNNDDSFIFDISMGVNNSDVLPIQIEYNPKNKSISLNADNVALSKTMGTMYKQ